MMNLETWKQQLYHEPLYGCFVTFASPAIAEFTAMLGFDFLLIDNEHGNMDMSTVEDMVRASQCAGVPAVVRAAHNSYEPVQKALDMGANGVQIPMINNSEDAQKAFQLTHFPPAGNRGTAYLTRAARYGLYPDKQAYLTKANETKLVSVHIETLEAVKNLGEILEVDGLDVFFIGPGDLSSSMGLAPGNPEVLKVAESCIRKIRAKGKIAGIYTGDVDSTKQAVEWGANYIVTAITSHMAKGAQQFLQALRK
jgi:4-hydroxy-2-oxoheptanedioate aldolase